jgi:hypothetical protein
MNQDTVKEKLQSIYESPIDYVVIFSGKKSKKVNGLYKPDSREIIIHNRNFIRDDGTVNDNMLMFTAIHELAHHVLMAEMGQKNGRAHSQLFWATFHDLVDNAESLGLYQLEIDDDTQTLIDEARGISCEIAELQRKLGKVLLRLNETCHEKGIRFEDVVERKAQLSMQTMKKADKALALNLPEDIGVDIQETAIKERDKEKRNAIIHAWQEGKSVAQAKKAASKPVVEEDETASLMKEKKRIERTVESLTRRLEELEEQLRSRGEL